MRVRFLPIPDAGHSLRTVDTGECKTGECITAGVLAQGLGEYAEALF